MTLQAYKIFGLAKGYYWWLNFCWIYIAANFETHYTFMNHTCKSRNYFLLNLTEIYNPWKLAPMKFNHFTINVIIRIRPLTQYVLIHALVHKTFRVFALYCRVTLQLEGLVIKRSVTEVLMEMSCLDIQCDKHQVFHIQVSCLL